MVDKGHCMYDVSADGGAFYGVVDGLVGLEELRRRRRRRSSDASSSPSSSSSRRDRGGNGGSRVATAAAEAGRSMSEESSEEQTVCVEDRYDQQEDDVDSDGHDNVDASISISLSTPQQPTVSPTPRARAQRQTSTLTSQLSHLRESDRRSLQHLPTSQQRALLATHHKQMEKGGRATNAKRGALESAGNYFGRLGTVRLIRQPPHTGRVQSLKH